MSDIYIPLVDKEDNVVDKMEKIKAHKQGRLHRAFSILVFDKDGRLLIQQRNIEKYHCGGFWSNTCCSHPNYGEELEKAVHRRLKEEMGFDCEMEKQFDFVYEKKFDNGLIEHELDHVYFGEYNGKINTNPDEVQDYKRISLKELKKDINAYPKDYTYWFRKIIKKIG